MNASTKMKRLGNNPYMQGLKPVSFISIIMAMVFIVIIGWGVWSVVPTSLHVSNLALEKFEELQQEEAQAQVEFEAFLKR